MMIHEITAQAGRHKQSKRVGRGRGAGGKRSGRGQKGAGSRSGNSRRAQFEGGQMPYFRRLAKYGFSNAQFTTRFWIVNLRSIIDHADFASGTGVPPVIHVTAETLIKAGLIRDDSRDVKILGDLGDRTLGVKLNVSVSRVSTKARQTIEGAGGAVNETGTRRDRVRGVDRNAEDQTPKNLTKKLRRFRRRGPAAAAPVPAAPPAGGEAE